jgi:hypothetical protein
MNPTEPDDRFRRDPSPEVSERTPAGAGSTAAGRVFVPILTVLCAWVLLACREVRIGPWSMGLPLTRWLRSALGEEGVRPGRDFLEKVVVVLVVGLAGWWLQRHARRIPATEPELVAVIADLKAAAGLLVLFVASVVALLVCGGMVVFGGPGTWLDDNVGSPPLAPLGVTLLAGVTLLLGLALRHLDGRVRHHPRDGKEPRPPL